MAVSVVGATDPTLLAAEFYNDAERQVLVDDINSRNLLQGTPGVSMDDQIVSLYTCTTNPQNDRAMVFGKLTYLGPRP